MEPASGVVFDVQRFSVHDGPGIRTTVFLKGCPLHCPWCQNPESLRPAPELSFAPEKCRASGECLSRCERRALMAGPVRLARERCDGCGACVPACAFGAFELVGRRVTVPALVEELARDRAFYVSSGGGVTLSGGEPTFQLPFMAALAKALGEAKIPCGLETCGAFRWESFAPHLPLFEFVFFDLKLMSPEAHRALIGGDNAVILENARRLARSGARVVFRSPMVAGYTDTEENLAAMAELLSTCGVNRLHLLGYHPMGEAKLARVGAPLSPLTIRDPLRGPALLERATQRLRAHGIEAIS